MDAPPRRESHCARGRQVLHAASPPVKETPGSDGCIGSVRPWCLLHRRRHQGRTEPMQPSGRGGNRCPSMLPRARQGIRPSQESHEEAHVADLSLSDNRNNNICIVYSYLYARTMVYTIQLYRATNESSPYGDSIDRAYADQLELQCISDPCPRGICHLRAQKPAWPQSGSNQG